MFTTVEIVELLRDKRQFSNLKSVLMVVVRIKNARKNMF